MSDLRDMTDQQLLDELVHRGVLNRREGFRYDQWTPYAPRVECSNNFFRHREGEMWPECCKITSPPTHVFYDAATPIEEGARVTPDVRTETGDQDEQD